MEGMEMGRGRGGGRRTSRCQQGVTRSAGGATWGLMCGGKAIGYRGIMIQIPFIPLSGNSKLVL